jgi:FemAB-related protein (PEP-CTERM system-associated)
VNLEEITEPGAEWSAFVAGEPCATLAHDAAWASVMREAYGVEPHYLVARAVGGEIVGVLPLMRVPTLRGVELVSMPYLDTGGILTRDASAATALEEAALALAARCGARAVELRQLTPVPGLASGPAVDRVNLALRLPTSEDALWKALPGKVRNQTRKAQREGLTPWLDGAQACEAFYACFRENMRDLGSPVHDRAFYHAAARGFGDGLRFVVAQDGERPVGGLVAIHTGDRVTVPWASTLRAERRRCPNNLIYWEALRWAVARGARVFDFGRSPRQSGTLRFKLGWGAEEESLHWLRLGLDGARLSFRPPGDSPLMRTLSRVWSRLPLGVTDRLGPPLRRRLTG